MPSQVVTLNSTIESGAFSGEAAWNHIKIIGDEAHMYNSENNLKVRQFLVDIIGEFQALFEAQGREGVIESNNIIVRIRGVSNQRDALLISSHFDSTSVSKGVGDAGISIGVMLELIRTLVYNPRLNHDVILLFNNGEEAGLLGATAFVRHPWFQDVRGFINLEGTGAAPGTRSILFRTNSFEILKEWKRPYVNIGRREGIDIAFYTHRYLYHTPRDDLNHSHPLSAQQLGDNVKALTISLCNSETLMNLKPLPGNPPRDEFPPSPNFVFYDFFSSFVLTRGATYKGIISLMLIIVALLTVVKTSIEFAKIGPRRLFHRYVKPTLEAYLLTLLTVTTALATTAILSMLKLVWPRIAMKLKFRSGRVEIATLGGGTERRDVKGLPIERWLPYGLLGFWVTFLVGALIASFYKFYGIYFLSDWAFFSILSVGLTQAVAPLIIKWWRYDVINSDLSGWKTRLVKMYEKHMWIIQLIIASAMPSLLTLEVLEQILTCLPTLGAENLSETYIDIAFAFFCVLLYINLLPALHMTSRRFVITFFAIAMYIFNHLWDVSGEALAATSTVLISSFPSISEKRLKTIFGMFGDVDCEQTLCTINNVTPPTLGNKVAWNSTILITVTQNEATVPLPPPFRNESIEVIEFEGNFIGPPGSRVCTLEAYHSRAYYDDVFSVWIEPESAWRWQTADKGLIPQPRNLTWAKWANLAHQPVTVIRRDFNHADKRIDIPFLIRVWKDELKDSLSVAVECYHTEIGFSGFWDTLTSGLPDWVLQSHGR
ncbi:hypothetical protein BC829DRAFT_414981 [Chytridium lagenaria]|nr:hypothetical protein BC829DRAFT_414981 [Chytridium lagenaria]